MKPKVIIKKNLIIFRNPGEWVDIYARILKEFGMGMAVRTRLRRELGLTYRTHQEWIPFDKTGDRVRHYCEEQIHVDFYNESTQSWFMLRYLNNSAGKDTQII